MNKIIVFVGICTGLLLVMSSCNNKEKEMQEKIIRQAETIILDNENSDSYQVETAITSIKKHLMQYPDSKKYRELKNYIEKLYLCLDYHKYKDYSKQYQELVSEDFYTVRTAIEKQDKFLNEFTTEYGKGLKEREPQLQVFIRNIQTIKEEFNRMKQFFEQEFSGLSSYNYMVQYNSSQFDNSRFESVQKTWKNMVSSQRSHETTKDLNKKVENFESCLKQDAENICSYNFNGFVIDGNYSTQTVSLTSPAQHDKYEGKVCEGIFRVYLKGAYLGWDRGSVKIMVKGMIVVTVDDNKISDDVEYRRIDYTIIEKTGDL
jgi:hypothetical protein